jgi:hypothetical protein
MAPMSATTVVPAKAGTHFDFRLRDVATDKTKWIPAFAGMTI